MSSGLVAGTGRRPRRLTGAGRHTGPDPRGHRATARAADRRVLRDATARPGSRPPPQAPRRLRAAPALAGRHRSAGDDGVARLPDAGGVRDRAAQRDRASTASGAGRPTTGRDAQPPARQETLSANTVNPTCGPSARSRSGWSTRGMLAINPFRRSRRRAALNPLLPAEDTPDQGRDPRRPPGPRTGLCAATSRWTCATGPSWRCS